MRTPDGRECPYYYADFHRREVGIEVCRLLEKTPDAAEWNAEFCTACPVPEIRRANTCEKMVLHARIGRRRFWQPRRVLIRATCTLTPGEVQNPYVGCGQCHRPLHFVVAEPSSDGGKSDE
ncbi:MAG TPA: hypothetical protein ENN14_00620 [Chloroflexi bacterium]|nr:hypothetical protein [Chloroflexota bacterium]